MNHKTGDMGDISVKEGEDSLFRHLAPDTPEAKKIKSLQGREYEYAEYIGMLEYSIARYFYKSDRKITDRDAVSALKNIRKNCRRSIPFFNRDLEKEIIRSLIEVLEEKPVTSHELKLVIDYVLDIIDNRSWMGDEQAYIKWVAYIMDLFTEEEKEEYEKNIKALAAHMGLSSKHADLMLMKGEEEDLFEFIEEYGEEYGNIEEYQEESKEMSRDQKAGKEERAEKRTEERTEERTEKRIEERIEERTEEKAAERKITEEELLAEVESKFRLMSDAEKFDFLLERGPEFYEFVGLYIPELAEKREFTRIQELYSKLTAKYDNFLYLYVVMGATYLEIDPFLSKFYFQQALKTLDKLEGFSDATREKLRTSFLSFIEKIG
ncbi:hypothetical protein RSJ42_11405 [Methanosarcina hadiensis]|uniref:hypothetical protein n=1 Tax=Methanosarcina hadiensis TaxID=3078083 RepID=UPI003977A9A0